MKLSTKNLVIPTKEVKVDGFAETITIYPMSGFGLMKMKTFSEKLQKNPEDVEAQIECCKLALKYGCKCSDEDVDYLIENDLISSIQLTKEVIEFSSSYNEAKFKESELAKKNSKK